MITQATLEWCRVAKNVRDVRDVFSLFPGDWAGSACPISMFATGVLSILLIALIIGCANDTGESSTRHALTVAPLAADDHLQALGVAQATQGNWADDTWKFTSGDTRKFSFHSSSFPSVVQHHGMSPRVSLSLHYPKSLWPRSCSTRQRSQRASSTQCVAARKRQKKLSPGEGCPAQIRCAVRSKTLSLGRPANITSDQPVFLSAVG